MEDSTVSVPQPPPPAGLTMPDGVDLLAAFSAAAREMHQAIVKAVDLLDEVDRAGLVEYVEGLPLDLLLALEQRMTSAQRWGLIDAARLLRHTPNIRRLFAAGRLSFGQVRGIAAVAHRARHQDLTVIDDRVEASLEEVDKLSPDDLVAAVKQAVAELAGARTAERREQRAAQHSFLAIQPSFDGGVRLYGELDPAAGATVLNALDDASDLPTTRPGERLEPGEAPLRARERAQGLLRICGHWLAGGPERKARPSLVVHVDLDQVTATAGGVVELAAPGILPTITAKTVERLAADADLRVVLFDGARPLAVSSKVQADDIPTVIRTALKARDKGCRFPGSNLPINWSEAHHILERHPYEDDTGLVAGGDHDPENLVHLARRWHQLVHRREWKLKLDPRTGELTISRNGRTWSSLPRGTPLKWPKPNPPPPPTPPLALAH